MMRDFAMLALLVCLCSTSIPGYAQQVVESSAGVAVAPGSLQAMLQHRVVLRGTLGEDNIQLTLKPKQDEDGFEGEYFVFGQSARILLAGEIEQNELAMEESRNGKDVSGQWEGTLQRGLLSGTWSSFDGTVTKPFSLTLSLPQVHQ